MSPNLFPSQEKFPVVKPEAEQIAPPEQKDAPLVETQPEQERQPEREQTPVEETDYGRTMAPTPVQRDETIDPKQAQKSKDLVVIEKILEEHVDEIFFSLPPEKQQEFKIKGEETAQQIQSLLAQTKVKVKQILSLIVSWLSFVPGVNKFFIEQQAEIKVNKLLSIRDKQQRL